MALMTLRQRNNSYRIEQKVFSAGTYYKRRNRMDVISRQKHYFQQSKNRLFICHNAEQSEELRKMCGKQIKFMTLENVNYKRAHDPFAEEIDLKK